MLSRILFFISAAAPALAGQITYVNQLPYQPLPVPHNEFGASKIYTVDVPQFDPHIGHLKSVHVLATLNAQGTVSLEYMGAGGGLISFYVGSPGSATPGLLCGFRVWGFYDSLFTGGPVAAFDGTIDYAGPSGVVVPFGPIVAAGWIAHTGAWVGGLPPGSTSPAALDLVTGLGTIPIVIDSYTRIQQLWNPQTADFQVTMSTSARVEITFIFEDYPARFCFGQDQGSQACPCPGTNGPSGGCPSSINPQGANLAASGSSSVGTDTFALTASGMPQTAPVLFLQGTTAQNAGTWFGDGRRCVGGLITRLGLKHATGGSATYPGPGDPPISVQGNDPVGSLRAYQVWYRNADPAFCTPATFNLTSGVATAWTP